MTADHTQLVLAAAAGRLDGVEELLRFGADVNRQTPSGATPLYIAARQGHTEVVEALLRVSAEVEVCMEDGSTPLFIACWHGNSSVVRVLLQAKACTDRNTDSGATPLFAASMLGHSDLADELLRVGASVNRATREGVSPLMAAAAAGHTCIVESLLRADADLSHLRDDGETALSVAMRNGRDGVVGILRAMMLARTLPRIAHAACARDWKKPGNPLNLTLVEDAEKNLIVELARAVHKCSLATRGSDLSTVSTTRAMGQCMGVSDSCSRPRASTESSSAPSVARDQGLSRAPDKALLIATMCSPDMASQATPYVLLAAELEAVEPAVSYYCLIFASGLILNAMKRSGACSTETETFLRCILDKADRARSHLALERGLEQLEAFVLRVCRACLETGTPAAAQQSQHVVECQQEQEAASQLQRLLLFLDLLQWRHGGEFVGDWQAIAQHVRRMHANLQAKLQPNGVQAECESHEPRDVENGFGVPR